MEEKMGKKLTPRELARIEIEATREVNQLIKYLLPLLEIRLPEVAPMVDDFCRTCDRLFVLLSESFSREERLEKELAASFKREKQLDEIAAGLEKELVKP